MNINEGDIISVKHYSGHSPFKSSVIEASGNILKFKLTKNFAVTNFFDSDPLVIGFEQNDIQYISEATIKSINLKTNIVEIEYFEGTASTDKRLSERFPVSFYGETKSSPTTKKDTFLVKNMSLTGISIISKRDYTEGETLCMYVYMDNSTVDINGTIVRKNTLNGMYEYGLSVSFSDFNAKNTVKLHLKMLKEEQLHALKDYNIYA